MNVVNIDSDKHPLDTDRLIEAELRNLSTIMNNYEDYEIDLVYQTLRNKTSVYLE